MEIDLFSECTTCEVNFSKVSPYIRQQVEDELNVNMSGNNFIITVTKSIADKYHIPFDAICKISYKKDTTKIEVILSKYIRNYSDHFLVFSEKNPWNGLPGYYFCNNFVDTVERPIETKIILRNESNNAIKCSETPYNTIESTTTYIIGLAQSEYEQLIKDDYMGIAKFVKSKIT